MATDWNKYRALMDATLERRVALGRDVRCPTCNAGVAKPCSGLADPDSSHTARLLAR